MFKVTNKDTRMKPNVNFEHIIVGWDQIALVFNGNIYTYAIKMVTLFNQFPGYCSWLLTFLKKVGCSDGPIAMSCETLFSALLDLTLICFVF